MNRAFCNNCHQLVPAEVVERDGKVFLVKDCQECGKTETLISSNARRYNRKRSLDPGFDYVDCRLQCVGCRHKNQPNLVFVDITNRCNLNCPCCINNTPAMGFLFEPPREYFEKIFDYLATLDPKPSVQLFGGEPTVRDDLFDLIASARARGLPTRVVTNGLKLADPDYCRRLVESRATILIAYDGSNPEIYKTLRGTAKALDLKLKALENIGRLGKAKVTLMTLAAKGFNDTELPEFFDFCHQRRHYIRAIYFMPLAHTWDKKDLDLEPERTTTEDIEQIVDDAFPGEEVEFLPAGFLGQVDTLLKCLRVKPLPFGGAHPNCESMYMLVSDGTRYLPLSHFLKGSVYEVARALRDLSERLARRLPADGKPSWALRLRAFLGVAGVARRHFRFDRVFKGKGLGKLWHALATLVGFLVGRKSRLVFERHTNVQAVLQLVVLPFEDRSNIETRRLERCPTGFVYYDPEKDEVAHVPTCAWGLFKNETMRRIADYYGTST